MHYCSQGLAGIAFKLTQINHNWQHGRFLIVGFRNFGVPAFCCKVGSVTGYIMVSGTIVGLPHMCGSMAKFETCWNNLDHLSQFKIHSWNWLHCYSYRANLHRNSSSIWVAVTIESPETSSSQRLVLRTCWLYDYMTTWLHDYMNHVSVSNVLLFVLSDVELIDQSLRPRGSNTPRKHCNPMMSSQWNCTCRICRICPWSVHVHWSVNSTHTLYR